MSQKGHQAVVTTLVEYRWTRSMKVDQQPQEHHSQLFTVRVWREDLGSGQSEWRGKAQHVLSGEAIYFREWPVLITFLLAKLTETGPHQVSGADEEDAAT